MINLTAIGRIADDSLAVKAKVASFRLVSSEVRTVKGERKKFDTSVNVACFFQDQIERCQWLCDGALVAISGTLRNRSYEKDGRKVWVTEAVASVVQPLADFLDEPVEDEPEEEFDPGAQSVHVPF